MTPTLTAPEQILKSIVAKALASYPTDLKMQISTLATAFGFRNVIRAENLRRSAENGIKEVLSITPDAMSPGMFLCLLIMLEITLLNERKMFSRTFSAAAAKLPELFSSFADRSNPNGAEVLMYQHVLEQLRYRG